MSRPAKEPWNDPGPSWRELQPHTQWTLRTLFALVAVIACFCAAWNNSDFRIPVVGTAVIAGSCFLLRDRMLGALIALFVGVPALLLMVLQMVVKSIEIAPP